MASLTWYQSANMFDQSVWYGNVEWAQSSSIKITKTTYDYIIYYGSFSYSSNSLTGGEIVRIVRDKLVYDAATSRYIYKEFLLENFSASAVTFNNFLNVGDAQGAIKYVLSSNDYISGSESADSLNGWDGDDLIYGRGGNDNTFGGLGNDTIDGGLGTDFALYAANKSTIVGALKNADNSVTIRTSFGTDTLINMEGVAFADDFLFMDTLVAQYAPPVYQTSSGPITASIYSGAVDFLQFQLLGSSSGDVATGSSGNDFINLLGGDDAANGGAGQDVLDGGIGSNFLTGGAGADTFFLDGRSGTNTWSTITDPSDGDRVNIWGWQQGTSQLILSLEGQGAEGFKGATFHYDLNGDRMIDTSITFSNVVLANIPTPSAEEVAGNGYLLFA